MDRHLLGDLLAILGIAFIILAGITLWYNYEQSRPQTSSVVQYVPANSISNPNPVRTVYTASPLISSREGTTYTYTTNSQQVVTGAAAIARASLANRLGISPNRIYITSLVARDWPDTCLGLASPGEFCAQVMIPGYEVMMQAGGQMYDYRTNSDGSIIRAAN